MVDKQPDTRPQPRYGELAPEGWSWTPEEAIGATVSPKGEAKQAVATGPQTNSDAASNTGAKPSYGEVSHETPPAGSNPPAARPASPASDRVTGVPHNLGIGSSTTSNAPAAQQSTNPDGQLPSYRPAAPPQDGQPNGQPKQLGAGRGDRITTIVLLGVGTFGALYFAMTMMLMPSSFNLIASILEVDKFTVPSSVQTLGTTGALIVLALYAIMLIFSIQRLRARKLAFWIPLVAGALSLIIVVTITMIAISQMPELLEILSDPDAAARLLNTGALLGQ